MTRKGTFTDFNFRTPNQEQQLMLSEPLLEVSDQDQLQDKLRNALNVFQQKENLRLKMHQQNDDTEDISNEPSLREKLSQMSKLNSKSSSNN